MDKISARKEGGFAHIFLILLLVVGLGVAVYLVQQKTNILPKASVSSPIPSSPPVLYWKLDDGSGTVASDSSGSGLNGTLLGGPTWTSGKIGGGLSFDGIDDVVRAGDDPRLNITASETIEFWANLKSASRFRTILTKGFVAPFPYRFEFRSDNKLQFIIHDGQGSGPAAVANTNIVGNWHHIAGVRDTAAKKLYIYIDGILEGTTYDATTASTGNSGNLILGGRLPVVGGTSIEKVRVAEAKDFVISGVIDDLRIYNYARTADQIKEDMGLFPTPTPTPTPTPAPTKRVFVTSTTYNGNLGGLAGADSKCQDRANAVSLGGVWKAWLSDSTTSAASRLNHNSGPYKLLNGVTVANNWVDLTDATLQNQINITEFKTVYTWPYPGQTPWARTNTKTDGSIYDASTSCNNWTSDSGSNWALIGYPTMRDSRWTSVALENCGNTTLLYCFEQ